MGEKNNEVFFTRHSKAAYRTYDAIVRSDNPEQPVNPEEQITPDLTPDGVALAKEKSQELLGAFDPAHDALFFVSSNEARALETAAIYRETALAKGFEIIKPKNVRSTLAQEIGQGDIRTVQGLSINLRNTLFSTVFNPVRGENIVNWEAVDPAVKEKFKEAQAIISADDKGSWGANFFAHSEEVEKILPELKSAEKVFNTQFKKIVKLIEFAFKKAGEHTGEKSLKILAFGHENYMVYMLNKYFGEHGIKNCESLAITAENGEVVVQKGSSKKALR